MSTVESVIFCLTLADVMNLQLFLITLTLDLIVNSLTDRLTVDHFAYWLIVRVFSYWLIESVLPFDHKLVYFIQAASQRYIQLKC